MEVFAVGFAPFSAGCGGYDDVAGAAEAREDVSDDFNGEVVHGDTLEKIALVDIKQRDLEL